ncbi:MAG: hypothetical protein ACTSQA_00185 [Candidatus Heimdallarchaeaceae archaeon]
MAQIITNDGKKIILDRSFNSSPTRTAPSQFKVGTDNTSPSLSDTDLIAPVSIDGDNFKNFVTGYPTLDLTNMKVTIRGLLLSTEANGNSLKEFGTVNSDGTPLMFSRSTHTAINKTSSIEIAYIDKSKLI